MRLKKNKKGFTLVEIIVVLVIMGILLAIAVPSIMGYISKAQDQRYIAEARNGFLGANTILAKENAKETAKSERSKLKADDINTEIGETSLITAMKCTVEQDGAKNKYDLKSCDIMVKSKTGKHYTFTANDEAVAKDGAIVDTAVEYPTAP